MLTFKYRPDVDGLRAVAVILVLLFHAELGLTGGYIGVDIFFVISGFLITGLILKEQRENSFTLANFWIRRIRRIIPASMAMVLSVLVVGLVILLPSDYEELAKSAIAQQFMLSNVYFWKNTGYFDGPSDLKPLLHTWSLAVEEQFYLGYPFLLLLLQRVRRGRVAIVLSVLLLFSFVISQYGVTHHPSATFFLLPTRAWEMLLGGMICFMPSADRLPRWLVSLCSWLSLAAIGYASYVYTSATPFPGIAALLPCGGAAILIYANSAHTSLPAAILASKPMVFVGLISYSLYLWHWPILAFTRYWLGAALPVAVACTALLCSVVIAAISWRYVEQPFRVAKKEQKSNAGLLSAYALSSSICIALSLLIFATDGFRFRFGQDVLIYDQRVPGAVLAEMNGDIEMVRQRKLPRIGRNSAANDAGAPDFILWGDSHARMLASGCDVLASQRNLCGIVAARGGHGPFLDYGVDEQIQWNREILNLITSQRIKAVILAGRWEAYFNRPFGVEKREAMAKTIRELHKQGVKVFLVEQVPLQKWDPNPRLARAALFKQPLPTGVTLTEYDAMLTPAKPLFEKVEAAGVHKIEMTNLCFDRDGNSLLGDKGGCYYWDENHLSPYGVEQLLGAPLSRIFDEIRQLK
jgi:peptidoglycan/LPS O-acetylase OafA/YrhL